jgi:hypothetical protein
MPRIYTPPDVQVTQFQPGDSSMLKMLKVTRWALLRGGTFKATELQARFGCTRSMAYAYYYVWRKVFGDQPPPRAFHKRPEPPATDIPKIALTDLLGTTRNDHD